MNLTPTRMDTQANSNTRLTSSMDLVPAMYLTLSALEVPRTPKHHWLGLAQQWLCMKMVDELYCLERETEMEPRRRWRKSSRRRSRPRMIVWHSAVAGMTLIETAMVLVRVELALLG